MGATPLLEVENVTVEYETDAGPLTAVSDVSFTLSAGEYFGLVGESGCGKSTLAKAILSGLDENGRIAEGRITFRGEEIQNFTEAQFNEEIRWKEISWIPQGSMSSLDPLLRISEQAYMIATRHEDISRTEVIDRLEELFGIVGLPVERIDDYPHQLSGGMKQRVVIALSLILEPAILIADEPTTALDVIMQDQVFKYLDEIKEQTDTSMVLITHDISLVFESCQRIGVMHAGQLAEVGPVLDVYQRPRHPYTILLKEAFPDVRYPNRELGQIDGHPPRNIGEIRECTFAERCPWAESTCRQEAPALEGMAEEPDNHQVSCFRKAEVHELYDQSDGAGSRPTEGVGDD